MYITGARIWWGQAGPDVWKPTLLLTAAPIKRVRAWLKENAWADALPLVVYSRQKERAVNSIRVVVPPAGSDWPCYIEGAPPGHPPPVIAKNLHEYLIAMTDSAAWCAGHLEHGDGAPWELFADCTSGPLALGAALVNGRAVALSASPPTLLSINLFSIFGATMGGKSIVEGDGGHVMVGAGFNPTGPKGAA